MAVDVIKVLRSVLMILVMVYYNDNSVVEVVWVLRWIFYHSRSSESYTYSICIKGFICLIIQGCLID